MPTSPASPDGVAPDDASCADPADGASTPDDAARPAVPGAAARADDANEVAVLVPAAGQGTRLGGRRKQFRQLGGQALLVQTLRAFERSRHVGHLIVASPEDEVRHVSDQLLAAGLTKMTAVVSGGDSRQESVRNALRAVPAPVEVVLVHDAVRPFVTRSQIGDIVGAVREYGAASLAIPVADTLRRADRSADRSATKAALQTFADTVDRSGLWRMQTPQGFRRAWLENAHATDDNPPATDDVELVQRLGHDVRLVRGDRHNFKITTPGDWQFATTLWPEWERGITAAEE